VSSLPYLAPSFAQVFPLSLIFPPFSPKSSQHPVLQDLLLVLPLTRETKPRIRIKQQAELYFFYFFVSG
jgi:hypothetical protein